MTQFSAGLFSVLDYNYCECHGAPCILYIYIYKFHIYLSTLSILWTVLHIYSGLREENEAGRGYAFIKGWCVF